MSIRCCFNIINYSGLVGRQKHMVPSEIDYCIFLSHHSAAAAPRHGFAAPTPSQEEAPPVRGCEPSMVKVLSSLGLCLHVCLSVCLPVCYADRRYTVCSSQHPYATATSRMSQITCLYVHRSGGLVHDDDAGLRQEGSGDTQQLPLPHRKVGPAVLDAVLQPPHAAIHAGAPQTLHKGTDLRVSRCTLYVIIDTMGYSNTPPISAHR